MPEQAALTRQRHAYLAAFSGRGRAGLLAWLATGRFLSAPLETPEDVARYNDRLEVIHALLGHETMVIEGFVDRVTKVLLQEAENLERDKGELNDA